MRITGYPRPPRRKGWTLIELLVVISIISILISLLLAGVMKARGVGPRVETRSEISDFEIALKAAAQDMGQVDYLPSRLVLREDGLYDKRSTDHVNTVTILTKMFGKNVVGKWPAAPATQITPAAAVKIDWNGNGTIQSGDMVLEGPQCLMFYTGGIPTGGVPTGFSKQTNNPAAPGGQRFGPYFTTYKKDRLGVDSNGFLYYIDPYRSAPYMYFSSNGGSNDYNTNTNTVKLASGMINTGPDCPPAGTMFGTYKLNIQLVPYRINATQFVNPKGFQIISAGSDTLFGDPTKWTPTAGYGAGLGGGNPGADDIANFSKSPLAGAQN
jgi:prepilin-type N-terminal cleavage/methylation domain-containing protein